MSKQTLDFIDAINSDISRNLRRLKREQSLTNADLGAAMGVSYQQVQKHVKGEDRISAARLRALSIFAQVPMEHFFRRTNEG